MADTVKIAWLKQLGVETLPQEHPPREAPGADTANKAVVAEALNIPGVPIPIPVPDLDINVSITLDNRTGNALELV